ncbi:alpha/beta fold hydrolase [Chloroflexus aggregans]|uniref:Alpha/beta hydrolase fold protein n=1 Tax=Chloroflexus aggregans (strain MD-66 / DSM 9485) TaxID=326427 RepID=B8G5J1_CHLAD|nr:alpha/beta hydrolase [Chloroflexus aggregans]ACL25697.1 alpha/beta hydrolase fold protein [Chloroflexus aggregans DSM 9485]
MTILNGFQSFRETIAGVTIAGAIAGSGPPLLLLHGYPQTHAMWHAIAPVLAASFTIVAADLRGYGDSDKPVDDSAHLTYSKRAMAADMVGLMEQLGFPHFAVIGHDRGARVTHRMCLDHSDRIMRAAVLDIVPTHHMYLTADREFATAYYHWFFLIQPAPLPERLIGADPEFWLRSKLAHWGRTPTAFTTDAVAEYLRCFRDPATIAASCADYRAAASIDLTHDDEDVRAGRKVKCPLLVLWGADGFVGRKYNVLEVWRHYAVDVQGHSVPGGHFLPEEAPTETLAALRSFLAG